MTWRVLLPPLGTCVVVLLLWEAIVWGAGLKPYLLPAPSAVLRAGASSGSALAGGFALTAAAAVGGLALSAVTGVVVAVALASHKFLERAVYPFTVFLQTVPLVAIAPLLVIWFGYGLKPVVVSAFVVSLFPVIASTFTGLRSVDPALHDLFRLYGASRWDRLWKLELPTALPALFTGLRVAAGLAVIGAVVGEFFASFAGDDAGLGMLVAAWIKANKTPHAFAAVGLASLLGLALFSSVNLCAWLVLRRWRAVEVASVGAA